MSSSKLAHLPKAPPPITTTAGARASVFIFSVGQGGEGHKYLVHNMYQLGHAGIPLVEIFICGGYWSPLYADS